MKRLGNEFQSSRLGDVERDIGFVNWVFVAFNSVLSCALLGSTTFDWVFIGFLPGLTRPRRVWLGFP